MRKINLHTRERDYDIYVGSGLLDEIERYFPEPSYDEAAVLIVADEHTAPLYAAKVCRGLKRLGYRTELLTLPAGEAHKNAESLGQIYEAAFKAGLGRRDLMLALGGGVIGDMTGFAAATYMRGIDFVQLPTSLLAQVDASVGGKTGIDTPFGKNLVGAFKQPLLVLADCDTLRSLPPEELASGMAEVVKYGLLAGESLFEEIEALPPRSCPSEELIAFCIEQKAAIVADDEKESGRRMILNLGHTFGHAIEKAGGYSRYTHGEAVGLGLLAALRIGELMAVTPKSILPRVEILLKRLGLPVKSDLDLDVLLPNITLDKKREGSWTRFVLLEDWGRPLVRKIDDPLLAALSESLVGCYLGVPDKLPERLRVSPGSLSGEVFPPPSKSEAHRLIICAALAEMDSGEDFTRLIVNYEEALSDDIRATARGIARLTEARRLMNESQAAPETAEPVEIDCNESGSTVRFLIPIAAALGVPARFTGRGRLPRRPLDAYRRALGAHGIDFKFPQEEGLYLPLELRGRLSPGDYEIAGDSSSQYISGLLFALSLLEGPSALRLTTALESAPYVDMTLSNLRRFGIAIQESWQDGRLLYEVDPAKGFQRPHRSLEIERDYSQAAFWFLAAYLGQNIEVKGLSPESLQGDRAIENLLKSMSERRQRESYKAAVEIDVSQTPDLFPALAVAAAAAGPGQVTRLVNASRLRIKESDRISAVADLLEALGVPHKEGRDYLEITAVSHFRAAEIESHNDHRLAMAAAVAALCADGPCLIRQASAVTKSYPHFFRELRRLGALVEEA